MAALRLFDRLDDIDNPHRPDRLTNCEVVEAVGGPEGTEVIFLGTKTPRHQQKDRACAILGRLTRIIRSISFNPLAQFSFGPNRNDARGCVFEPIVGHTQVGSKRAWGPRSRLQVAVSEAPLHSASTPDSLLVGASDTALRLLARLALNFRFARQPPVVSALRSFEAPGSRSGSHECLGLAPDAGNVRPPHIEFRGSLPNQNFEQPARFCRFVDARSLR